MAKTKNPAAMAGAAPKTTLMTISGVPVYWNGEVIEYTGEMTSCADGSPRAYGPEGCQPPPLDYLGNAGYPGNWWGITTDKYGNPYVQQASSQPAMHPYPGLYISCTAYYHQEFPEYDCRAWVNAEQVLFSVIPSNVRSALGPKFLGCRATVTDKKNGKVIETVCAEIGPSNHLGEASMAVCEAFGLDPNPKCGGSSDKKRFLYRFWPGVPAPGWVLI
jgi:hypothetical protein